jgi:hypothetical protein
MMQTSFKKAALSAAIALGIAVVAVSGAAYAAQDKKETVPGWGFGDKNHIHTGPPGHSVHP